ncbi:class I adenylate-forming enzyme family protein [Ruegeria lacuscaerulensis]|uniref:class I adenylate-forming enzyme family protein n=1 Tax=Ruegeria lacuscaerulensis TaxID=55218 RepID=UPI00147A4F50|nr:AMP-binding protein [Ruegeria lacuscaerulensis]
MTNLGYLVTRAARFWADRIALKDERVALSYAELDDRTNRLATALAGLGVAKGERVAVLAWNRVEIAEAEVALLKGGFVRVPINARLSAEEVVHVCADSQVRVLITDEAHLAAAQQALTETSGLQTLLVMGEGGSYEDALTLVDNAPVCVEADPDDIAVHHYTSGSSGVLKAAMHSVRNRRAILRKITFRSRLYPDQPETFLHVGPITHVSGMALLPMLAQGHTNIILSRFDVDTYLSTLEREKVTQTYLVPTMINRILAAPNRGNYDLSSLKLLRYGAAPISPTRLREAVEFFGPILNQGYGAGEVCSSVTMLTEADHRLAMETRPELFQSCGRPLFESEVKVVDDAGNEMPVGEAGELVIRGEDVMQGYHNAPELTEPVLKNGYYHTGDIAYMDDTGYIFIVDRKKDMIVTGGFNVYPNEVENALFEHPEVYEVCVVGVPDSDLGEAVKAVIVPRDKIKIDADALIAHCVEKLGKFKKPHSIDIVNELPKNDAGKILRRRVRDGYWANSDRKV